MSISRKQRVLIVEADILIRQPLADYLHECGYDVIETVNDDEAREFLARGAAAVDAVLADANDGQVRFGLATWIRQNYPRTEVILAGTLATAAERAADLCADGLALSKPYDHHIVLDRIRRSIAARDRK